MVKRLRTRLRQARVTVERDLGYSLTSIVNPPLHLSTRSHMLSARAHSYLHGDFMPLHSASVSVGARALPSTAASSSLGTRSKPAVLQHYQSATDIAVAPQQQVLLHLPSSPSVPRTPLTQPLDNDNDIARTILMLATPPSLLRSPCQQPTQIGRPAAHTSRRLSFSRCQAERPNKRSRLSDNGESSLHPAAQVQEQVLATGSLSPNLSRIAALSRRTMARPRPKRHARSAAPK
ncbi:hypothetical protein FBU31_004198 [Coemansia sp. 'formosensis']|nr:hypothetical protein FBU31_004198 [Coemansia sp. 'formosensis']